MYKNFVKTALSILCVLLLTANPSNANTKKLIDLINQNNIYGLQSALESGANPDERGNYGITPLMVSISRQNYNAAKLLIKFGADVNSTDIAGVSPLHIAARNGHYEIAKALIDAGANINAKDKYGMTPLAKATAAHKNRVMQLLVENNALDKEKAVVDNKETEGSAITVTKENLPKDSTIIKSSGESKVVTQTENKSTFAPIVRVKENNLPNDKIEKAENSKNKKKKIQISYKAPSKQSTEASKTINAIDTTMVTRNALAPNIENEDNNIDLAWLKDKSTTAKAPEKLVASAPPTKPKEIAPPTPNTPQLAHIEPTAKSVTFESKKHKKITVGKAKLIHDEGITKWKVNYQDIMANNNGPQLYWLIINAKKTNNYGSLLNKAIKQVQNYKIKYQIVQNIKTKEKYLKVGALGNANIAEVYCKRVLEDNTFTACKVVKFNRNK
ncbi:MAG: ankyrin repeat domain-containing protein [Sphingobacteriia bacterium]|nr:ankyrin repeat domain-containing protein [Sphingobacteriia bacterium]